MPTAPLRFCPRPGCPNRLPHRQARLCAAHDQAERRRFEESRPSSTARGYDRRWQRTRVAHLAREPDCRACGAPATEVDHITRRSTLLARGVRNPDAHRFLQSLCHPCHATKTRAETNEARHPHPPRSKSR